MKLSSKELIRSKLDEYFDSHSIDRDSTFLVAFSGGCDSLCLLSCMAEKFPGKVGACYVNHRLRSAEELEKEEAINIENCKKLNVPLFIKRLGLGDVEKFKKSENISIEAAARALRYRELERLRTVEKYKYIVTAHTKSDQAETVLMRLYTGSTLHALSGIASKTEVVLRPIIELERKDTEAFCKEENLMYSVDSSNEDTSFLRNHMRLGLLPGIRALYPEIEGRLVAIAQNMNEAVKKDEVLPFRHLGPYSELSISDYNMLSLVGKSRSLIALLSPYFKSRVSNGVIKQVSSLMAKGEGRLEYDNLYVRIRYEKLVVFPKIYRFVKVIEKLPTDLNSHFSLVKGEDLTQLSIDPDLIKGKLIMRMSTEGDVITLSDKITLVSDVTSSQKVPYALVLEDQGGIVALFTSVFGGRDRLSKRFLSIAPNPANLYSVIYRI